MRGSAIVAALALAYAGTTLSAQEAEPADATAIVIPPFEEVSAPAITNGRDEKVVRNGWKHFYFYRPDTTYEEAYADIADCYRFLPVGQYIVSPIPTFVPWESQAYVQMGEREYAGLLGEYFLSLINQTINRRSFQSRMRRCMEPKGYERYPADEATWEQIIDNYSLQSIAIQAKLVALGPPDADPLPVTK